MVKMSNSDRGLMILNAKNEVTLRLNGFSMYPFLKQGDVGIINKRNIESLHIGDVAVFASDNSWIAHRLIGMEQHNGQYNFLTKGDTCVNPDNPFTHDNYIGKLTSYVRNGRVVNIEGRIQSRIGYLIAITSKLNTPFFVLNKKIMRRLQKLLK